MSCIVGEVIDVDVELNCFLPPCPKTLLEYLRSDWACLPTAVGALRTPQLCPVQTIQ